MSWFPKANVEILPQGVRKLRATAGSGPSTQWQRDDLSGRLVGPACRAAVWIHYKSVPGPSAACWVWRVRECWSGLGDSQESLGVLRANPAPTVPHGAGYL